MLRKAAFALTVVVISLLGASVAGAQQYPPSSMGTTASSLPEEVISKGLERNDPPSVLGAQEVRSSSPLARTGIDATTLGTIALVLFGGGAVLVAASRRPTRRL